MTVTHQQAPSAWLRVVGVSLLLTVVVTTILVAFAWPASRTTVHGIPIAVVGSAQAAQQVESALDQHLQDGFTVAAVPDGARAEQAVRERDVYAAIDLSGPRPTVLVASAASPVVAQAVQTVASGLGSESSAPGPNVEVRDLAPLPDGDRRGAGLAAGVLPLVLGGMLGAIVIAQLITGIGRRLVTALLYSVLAGTAMTLVLQTWLGSLGGDFWANASVLSLAVAAITTTILGLEALLGAAGFALGAVMMMILGNPLSGVSSAPEMLPGWSGTLGQYLPPGAAGWLLRSTAFFDGSGADRAAWVLTGWLLVGLGLMAAGTLRERRRAARTPQLEGSAVTPVVELSAPA